LKPFSLLVTPRPQVDLSLGVHDQQRMDWCILWAAQFPLGRRARAGVAQNVRAYVGGHAGAKLLGEGAEGGG